MVLVDETSGGGSFFWLCLVWQVALRGTWPRSPTLELDFDTSLANELSPPFFYSSFPGFPAYWINTTEERSVQWLLNKSCCNLIQDCHLSILWTSQGVQKMGQGTATRTFRTTVIFEDSAPLSGISRIHRERRAAAQNKEGMSTEEPETSQNLPKASNSITLCSKVIEKQLGCVAYLQRCFTYYKCSTIAICQE